MRRHLWATLASSERDYVFQVGYDEGVQLYFDSVDPNAQREPEPNADPLGFKFPVNASGLGGIATTGLASGRRQQAGAFWQPFVSALVPRPTFASQEDSECFYSTNFILLGLCTPCMYRWLLLFALASCAEPDAKQLWSR